MHRNSNTNYIHHQDSKLISFMREIVFGMEDGMVSTLGAVTGIAVGSDSHTIVILAGMVIISVESISMGVGSYLADLSESEVKDRKIYEERQEIKDFPKEEKEELRKIYIRDGWPKDLAVTMAEAASKDKNLMLNEMAHHELQVVPEKSVSSLKKGLTMFFAYILGGLVPLFAYFFWSINTAIYISIFITLIGLFILGATTTHYTKGSWIKTGARILILGGVALGVGYFIGNYVSTWLGI